MVEERPWGLRVRRRSDGSVLLADLREPDVRHAQFWGSRSSNERFGPWGTVDDAELATLS